MPRSAMPVTSIPSTHDLRSHAVDEKRERESKTKWMPKWDYYSVPVAAESPREVTRPVAGPRSQKGAGLDRRSNQKAIAKLHAQKKRPVLRGDEAITSDSSSADEDMSRSRALVEEEDYKYSFDARRGPAQGDEILTQALSRAVEVFEDHETTKLVKNEYEILDCEIDDHAAPAHAGVDDDDYELI